MPQFVVRIIKTVALKEFGTATIEADTLEQAIEKSEYIHELHSPIDLDEIVWSYEDTSAPVFEIIEVVPQGSQKEKK